MIKFKNTLGSAALIRLEDILNVWDVPDKHLRVINFKQGKDTKELWTEETIGSIWQRIRDAYEFQIKE